MEKLTARQQKVMDFISNHLGVNGYPPTLREIASHMQISGTLGVMKHLEALEKKGLIRKQPGSSRGITLAGATPSVSVPIAGTVRAGALQPAVEEIEGYVSIDRGMIKGEGCFFLRVRGDSMINAAIMEGDLALVRPQSSADNRDIVVAMVGGEATLKRFYRRADHIRLQPENPNMEPIIMGTSDEEVVIVGKVIGIYRHL